MKQEAYTSRRIPELDGVRVLLIFLVSWYHFWQQSWLTPYIGGVSLDFLVRSGYMHVDGTILLSAFLLFLPYARHMYENERLPDRAAFYRRRVARVVPSYYFITLLLLLAVALPWGLFYSTRFMVKDILTHFTFTFTFFPDTYRASPLGGASWTLMIEMQAYLLFPFVAGAAVKRPKLTLSALVGAAWLWRGVCILTMDDLTMVVNQLPSFLDVYALGMLAAMVYVRLTRRQKALRRKGCAVFSTLLAALCVWLLVLVIRQQAATELHENLQARQMILRPAYTAILAVFMLCLPFCLKPVRFLFGNRLMKQLSAVSFNYYLIHQNLAVHLKRLGIPKSVSEAPNVDGELSWQRPYMLLCFGLSLLLAFAVTYLVEKPCARWLENRFSRTK